MKDFLKRTGKKWDIIWYSLAWMIISVVAAFPSFALKGDTSVFSTTTRDEYCEGFLLPILLFLLAFIFDFVFSIKDLSIGSKRGELFKLFTIFICTLPFFMILITIFDCVILKVLFFLLLWVNISFIKGLTVLIPGEEEIVVLTRPINTYK